MVEYCASDPGMWVQFPLPAPRKFASNSCRGRILCDQNARVLFLCVKEYK